MTSRDNLTEQKRINLEAAAWLTKQDRGFTAAEQDEFFQWLSVDPRHGEWLARHRETWADFNLLAQWKPEHSAEPNPDLLRKPVKARRARAVWYGALALAACIAVGFFLRTPASKAVPSAPTDTALAAPLQRQVLADGSVVELNRGAQITVNYSETERRVELVSGEASFTVAKNPQRPFIVSAGGVAVRAVGTVFNVKLDARAVEVLVTEGKVQVNPPSTSRQAAETLPLLEPGDHAVVLLTPSVPPQVTRIDEREMSRLLAWQPRLLDFDSTPLSEVVAEFNQRNQVQLRIADEELASLPIVASFRSDNVEGFVRLLEMTAGIKAEHTGQTITLRKAP